jgi:hypothetical protein
MIQEAVFDRRTDMIGRKSEKGGETFIPWQKICRTIDLGRFYGCSGGVVGTSWLSDTYYPRGYVPKARDPTDQRNPADSSTMEFLPKASTN